MVGSSSRLIVAAASSDWFSIEGNAFPLGATWLPRERAFNFSLYSKHATKVTLLLFREGAYDSPSLQLKLDHLKHKSGRGWHCRLTEEELGGANYYAYRIDGPRRGGGFDMHAFDPDKILLDPYAKEVFFPPKFDREAAKKPGCNLGRAPLGVLVRNGDGFDWEDDHVRHHEHDLVIYELHVRGLTRNPNSCVAPQLQGTFLGVIEKIPYLKQLGITAVELMPVFQFDPQEGNYWGYMPLNFFAPHSQFALEPRDAVNEFRAMVKELHKADIEVLLDVVFNHTAEGDQHGVCYSFKGIDNSSYYVTSGDPSQPYVNYSGTGNTLHTANRHVVRMILDSMRHWVQSMHVDGFRFDLASVFTRNSDGSVETEESPLISAIRSDPVLGRVRLIAEPWDAAGLRQLGRAFPGKRWWQWNGMFRDDIRRFVNGEYGFVPMAMRRIYGSDDLFPDTLMEACHPYQSINYVNSHDGFTLYDHFAYNERHNWANGEQNRDGHRENYSWNCGWEGDAGVPDEVMQLRLRQAKNMCVMLMISNGTPMFRAGDEFLQTQFGNNNPYNQDNEVSWIDWDRLEKFQGVQRFFRAMIDFRKRHRCISRSRFWREDVGWYGTDGGIDMSPSSRHFAFFVNGESQSDDSLYVMLNFEDEPLTFVNQKFADYRWMLVADTYRESPEDAFEQGQEPVQTKASYEVGPKSIAVFISTALQQTPS